MLQSFLDALSWTLVLVFQAPSDGWVNQRTPKIDWTTPRACENLLINKMQELPELRKSIFKMRAELLGGYIFTDVLDGVEITLSNKESKNTMRIFELSPKPGERGFKYLIGLDEKTCELRDIAEIKSSVH